MSLGDEAAAASTRYTRRPVVGNAPAKVEETPVTEETAAETTANTNTEQQ
jgi:hypothetical protein